jgi:hypothetical protein
MKIVWMSLSILGLVILPIMPVMQLAGHGSAEHSKWGIAIGTVLWFATAPLWMKGKTDNE